MKQFDFRIFAAVIVGLLTLLVLLQGPTTSDPFMPENTQLRAQLDTLPIEDLAAYKHAHARSNKVFDLGLFGNSRSVMISHDDLGLAADSFFNFSLPGGSMRQSIALLEELVRDGKAPRHAVISLDHLELQYYAPPDYPAPFRRWALAANDVESAWSGSGSPIVSAKVFVDRFLLEWGRFKSLFNISRLRNRMAARYPDIFRASTTDRTTRPDGSRSAPFEAVGGDFRLAPQVMAVGVPQMIAQDFERLDALTRQGVAITIYESPLAPGALDGRPPAADALALRRQVSAACDRFALTCHLAPPELGDTAQGWPDCCHAPAPVLANYLKSFLMLPAKD